MKLLMTGALALGFLLGPRAFWARQILTEERKCACVCGQVFAIREDLPAPNPPGEVWHPSDWFGAHETICFTTPRSDYRAHLKTLQAEANRQRWLRECRAESWNPDTECR